MRPNVLVSSFLAVSLSAQTIIVDVNGGPGATFTSLTNAVAAAPDGATLIVRPGSYGGFTIDGKGLVILGQGATLIARASGGPFVISPYVVRNTQPSQPVVISGFTFGVYEASIKVQNCLGPVHIEDVQTSVASCNCTTPPPPTIWSWTVAQLTVRDCSGWGVTLIDTEAVLERCTFTGASSLCFLGTCSAAQNAVSVSGRLDVVDCTLIGGGGGQISLQVTPNAAALSMFDADVRLLGASVLQSGLGIGSPTPAPAIQSAGVSTLQVDPAVALQTGAASAVVGVAPRIAPLPYVTSLSAGPGSTISAVASGPIGATTVLVVGLPGPATTVAGIPEPFWMSPILFRFAAFGTPQPGAPVAGSVLVPAQPQFRGLRIAWQSVALLGMPSPTLSASNPSVSLVD